jgi:hypothetical protein
MGACGRKCVRRSVRLYEGIIYQTHVIIDPVAFGRIDDAQLRTIQANFELDVFTHYYVTEIRDLLLPSLETKKPENSRAAFDENHVREA